MFSVIPALGLQMKFSNCANSIIFTLTCNADMLINMHSPNSIKPVKLNLLNFIVYHAQPCFQKLYLH